MQGRGEPSLGPGHGGVDARAAGALVEVSPGLIGRSCSVDSITDSNGCWGRPAGKPTVVPTRCHNVFFQLACLPIVVNI